VAILSRVLVVNAGSTSLKLSVVDSKDTSREVESLADSPGRADAVGHRVVHGGPRLVEPVLIDDAVLAEIDALSSVAPLHNTPALNAIAEARTALPDVPHVAVFDTAFHVTLPEHGHEGSEITMVLRGTISDSTGLYRPGDVCDIDESIEHAPIAGEGGCICVVAQDHPDPDGDDDQAERGEDPLPDHLGGAQDHRLALRVARPEREVDRHVEREVPAHP